MADDNRYRSTRLGDSYRRATQPQLENEPITGSDPLAELARLIGKNDPYAEFGLSTSRQEEQQGYSSGASAHEGRDPASSHQHHDHRYDEGYSEVSGAAAEDYAGEHDQENAQDQQQAYQQPARAYDQESWRSTEGHREPRFEDELRLNADVAGFHQDEPQAHEARTDEYLDHESALDPDTEQMYDDPPRTGRRGGLATALALIGCAMLGTAGAYAFRSYYGPPTSTQPPPIITADNSIPTKIVPPPAGDAQASKAIQDRLANAGREQIVSKQEEPVALKDIGTQAAPRVVLPAPVAPAPVAPVPMTSQPPPASAAGSSNEPRKVRTVTIRPDGGDAGSKPPANRSSGAPISLDPQAQEPTTPAPAARTRSAAAPPPAPRAIQESPSGGTGGFLVQLSSQKTEAEAAASFRSLQAKFPNELGHRQPFIQRADLGSKGVFYRTMVGPFTSAQEANQFCASYKAGGGHCVVPGN